ncbi:MAG: septum formation initiator family protein [Bacteroides sp.]
MVKLITIWDFIGRHKYWITVFVFVAIIGFIDENSLIRRIGYAHEISEMQTEINQYRANYKENTQRLKELTTNPDVIEQIARERYLMKKSNEDIYVFKEKE